MLTMADQEVTVELSEELVEKVTMARKHGESLAETISPTATVRISSV